MFQNGVFLIKYISRPRKQPLCSPWKCCKETHFSWDWSAKQLLFYKIGKFLKTDENSYLKEIILDRADFSMQYFYC